MAKISVKEAIAAAKSIMKELFEDDPLRDLSLEEIKLSEGHGDKKVWHVTLGFHRSRSVSTQQNGLSLLYQKPNAVENRVYKIIDIDAESGEFLGMDIRPDN